MPEQAATSTAQARAGKVSARSEATRAPNAGAANDDDAGERCKICLRHDEPEKMLLCDSCGDACHYTCLGASQLPSDASQMWFCWGCRRPGMRIQVALPDDDARTRSRVRWCWATILAARRDGSCKLREDSGREHMRVLLDELQWHPEGKSAAQSTIHAAIVATVAELADTELTDAELYSKPPKSAKEALSPSNKLREYWAGAMTTHYQKLFKKGVFVVVDKQDVPPGALRLPTMWVFVIKPDKFSARLVVLGNRAGPADVPTAAPTPRASV